MANEDFFIISFGLHFFFSLSKCLDHAQSFLDYILLTKPSFHISFLSSASCGHPSWEGLW